MSNLSRYDPFSIEPMSDMFHGLFRPLRSIAGSADAPLAEMKIDDDVHGAGAALHRSKQPGGARYKVRKRGVR